MIILKNNKGLTIVELIVSIALISVALLFLFRILVVLGYDENYEGQNTHMIVNKSQIIKNIQTDFIEKKLTKVTCNEALSKTTFTFNDSSVKSLTLKNQNLLYGVTNKEVGRALDKGYVYGGITVSKNTVGNNSYLLFNISVNNENTGITVEEHRIKFVYVYKNNEVVVTNC